MNLSKEGRIVNENKNLIYDDEKTISLVDLCFYLLSKWKLMVIVAIILAIVAGGFTYMKSSKASENSGEVLSLEGLEDSFETEDALMAAQNKIAKIEEYKQNMEERDYYLENSVKIKLNPNRFYEGIVSYVVSASDERAVLKAVALLENAILSEETFEKMAAELADTKDTALLKEVLAVETEYHTTGATVVVKVRHYVQEECEKMLDVLPKNLTYVELVDAQVKTKSDYTLISFSSDMLNARNTAYDTMKSLENGMSELEKAYYEMLKNPDEVKVPVQKTEASVDLKMVIIAAFLGAFCVAGLYGVFYLFSGYVHTKEELESWVDMPVLDVEENLEMNATMLAGIVTERNVSKLYLTSSLESANVALMKNLEELLLAKNIEVIVGECILNNPIALQKAVNCGAIVLVEKCNKSKEKDIREEIVKVNSCGVRVLGAILEK